jgi:hypothetical protein
MVFYLSGIIRSNPARSPNFPNCVAVQRTFIGPFAGQLSTDLLAIQARRTICNQSVLIPSLRPVVPGLRRELMYALFRGSKYEKK